MHASYFCTAFIAALSYADNIRVDLGMLTCMSVTPTFCGAPENCTHMCKVIYTSIVSQAEL